MKLVTDSVMFKKKTQYFSQKKTHLGGASPRTKDMKESACLTGMSGVSCKQCA